MFREDTVFFNINPFEEYEKVKEIWLELQEKSSHSYFLSWQWIENWLKCLPDSQFIEFTYGTFKSVPIVAYFVGHKNSVESQIIYCNRGHLNATGCADKDEITIEHNGVLLDRNAKSMAPFNLFPLKSSNWDEYYVLQFFLSN